MTSSRWDVLPLEIRQMIRRMADKQMARERLEMARERLDKGWNKIHVFMRPCSGCNAFLGHAEKFDEYGNLVGKPEKTFPRDIFYCRGCDAWLTSHNCFFECLLEHLSADDDSACRSECTCTLSHRGRDLRVTLILPRDLVDRVEGGAALTIAGVPFRVKTKGEQD